MDKPNCPDCGRSTRIASQAVVFDPKTGELLNRLDEPDHYLCRECWMEFAVDGSGTTSVRRWPRPPELTGEGQ